MENMDFLPATATSLVFARETYTPYCRVVKLVAIFPGKNMLCHLRNNCQTVCSIGLLSVVMLLIDWTLQKNSPSDLFHVNGSSAPGLAG